MTGRLNITPNNIIPLEMQGQTSDGNMYIRTRDAVTTSNYFDLRYVYGTTKLLQFYSNVGDVGRIRFNAVDADLLTDTEIVTRMKGSNLKLPLLRYSRLPRKFPVKKRSGSPSWLISPTATPAPLNM